MSDRYYSSRKQAASNKPNPELGANFWGAFLIALKRFGDENYLCKDFPSECCDGIPIYYSDEAIASRLREEVGQISWPISMDAPPATDQILDIVEFFYRFIAKPTESNFHSYSGCGGYHPTKYDIRQGRYDYTVKVNALLTRFNHPYKLSKGVIIKTSSDVLDEAFATVEFIGSDSHLDTLLSSAVENFYDRSGSKKLEALRSVVDAFERLKTLESSDKKQSATKVIGKLAQNHEINLEFEQIFKSLTGIANKFTIRHHEVDKVVLNDEALIDFLFYSYYNTVLLILRRYRLTKNV